MTPMNAHFPSLFVLKFDDVCHCLKKKNLKLYHFRHFPYVIFARSSSTADCENPISYGEGVKKKLRQKGEDLEE